MKIDFDGYLSENNKNTLNWPLDAKRSAQLVRDEESEIPFYDQPSSYNHN